MKFKVDNMTCNHCVMRITNALKSNGVKKVTTDLGSKIVTIVTKKHSVDEIKTIINDTGYNFELVEE